MNQKKEINYLYFSFFLFFLSVLSWIHYKEQALDPLFLLYAGAQSWLEISLFVLASYALKRWAPRWLFFLFIGASFLFLLAHFTNFIMVRLMDTSIGYIFNFFLGSGIDHFITGLQALNMNWTMVGLIVGALFAIPMLGVGFYGLTYWLAHRRPLHLSLNQIVFTIGLIGASILLLEAVMYPMYTKFQKKLPLGTTFLPPTPTCLILPRPLVSARKEPDFELEKKARLPNIYFFVIETLRKDFLDCAPNLTAFGNENIQFKHSFSNANSTHLSWFALFHADIPLHWAAMRDSWSRGSVPLRMLKKLGYQIHVYSSADLRYFHMDDLIFGRNRQLADSIEEYGSDRTLQPSDRDALAMQSLQRDLAKEGHAYLIFLDSTHSEYSFPKDFPLRYTPIAQEIDYLTIRPNSPELEQIKNRYRNSIAYIDQLMGDFFAALKKEHLFEDAIISITGDHGEEFFEEGALFHGTHLNCYQTSVPILLKFPFNKIPQTEEATHIDLFPSILHYLTEESRFDSLFDGKSVWGQERHPFRIAVLHKGPDTPVEFLIENREIKLHAYCESPSVLEIIELQGLLQADILAPLLTK